MTIYIYKGPGASPASALFLSNIFRAALYPHGFDVRFVYETELNTPLAPWRRDADLIVFGGGAFTEVKRALAPHGMEAIHDYVMGGGRYLGICQGGYAGADRIEFSGADGHKRNTGLGFFNGIARGALPITPCRFSGRSDSATVAQFCHEPTGTVFPALYWGGPSFDGIGANDRSRDLVTLLTDSGKRIVTGMEAHVGTQGGRAILTGYHPEAAEPALVMAWTSSFASGDADMARLRKETDIHEDWRFFLGMACLLDDLRLVPGHSFLRQIMEPRRVRNAEDLIFTPRNSFYQPT